MSIGKNLNISSKNKDEEPTQGVALKQETAPKPKLTDEQKVAAINQSVSNLRAAEAKAGGAGLENERDLNVARHMLIVFPVGDEEYAVSINDVKEVVPTPPIAQIPQVPDYIIGVANVRGNVLAIMDLAAKFSSDDENKKIKLGKFVLVVKSEDYKVAVNVMNVPNTMMVYDNEVDPPSNIINYSTKGLGHVKGIVKREKRMIVWIDLKEVLSQTDLDETK